MAEVQRLAGPEDSLLAQAEALNKSRIAAAEENVSRLEADQAEGAQFWTDMRKKITNRVEGLSKQEYDNTTNQMLTIGATLMASRFPNFGTALGEALGVGAKLKRDDAERVRKTMAELEARQDELAALERGEKRGDKKELRDARMGVNAAKTAAAESVYQINRDVFNRNFGLAKDFVDAVAKEQSAERIASTYAGGRAGAGAGAGGLTANQMAQLRDKAADNVTQFLKLPANFSLQAKIAKNPALRDELIEKEIARLLPTQTGTLQGTPVAAAPTRIRFDAQGNIIQ
jgi:hypothetical protein